MTFGVPLVVLPFSTDQFAGAAALEAAGFGAALAPNTASVAQIQGALGAMLDLSDEKRAELHELGRTLRLGKGHARIRSALQV